MSQFNVAQIISDTHSCIIINPLETIFYWCIDMKIALIMLAVLVLPIVSAVSDTTPPSIVSFDFEPKVVDVSRADQNITFTVRLKDDLSGVSYGINDSPSFVRFVSPSGFSDAVALFKPSSREPSSGEQSKNSHVSGVLSETHFDSGPNLVSGSMLNGTYVNNVTLHRYSERGDWHLTWFLLLDNVANSQFMTEQDIINLGFPTVIEVKA